MKLNNNALEKIDKHYSNIRREDKTYPYGLGLSVKNSINGAAVYFIDEKVCGIDDLSQLIYELGQLKTAIEKATGLMV